MLNYTDFEYFNEKSKDWKKKKSKKIKNGKTKNKGSDSNERISMNAIMVERTTRT